VNADRSDRSVQTDPRAEPGDPESGAAESAPETSRRVFLVNPASDNGATGRRWPELAHHAAELGLEGATLFSERRGHLAELAVQAAADGADQLVAVGGDGTLNEVANGLLTLSGDRPELAVIPYGTGMDFARSHGIPRKLDAAVDVALTGRVATIDAGRVAFRAWSGEEGQAFFANIASAGMSGAVARQADQSSKALGGRISFFTALVRVFARWRNTELSVDVGGVLRSGRMTNLIVAIGRYQGGGMLIAPEADARDGLFDVLVIGDITKRDFVLNVGKIYRGTHLSHPKIELLRAAEVAVEAEVPVPLELDGEQPGTTPARFEVLPGALKLRVPA
jgi:diacylglycerol kinase (ATP)